ncbi:MAG: hypothetical protein R3E79_33805 [Caldilineaceae bacterium]
MFVIATLALAISGLFTLLLGTAHFFFPILLDFEQAIPRQGPPLRPFNLGPIHYPTQRSDVYGIAWVMNHAASYTLVSVGVVDLCSWLWLGTTVGRMVAIWIAGWWFLRAAGQFYLGQRRGDWWIAAGFAWLAVVHVGVVWL